MKPNAIESDSVPKADQPSAEASGSVSPRIPMRETCQMCHAINTIGFHVPNAVWFEVIHPYYHNATICVNCFIRRADEKMVEWDRVIELYPVSKMTHLKAVGLVTQNAKLSGGKNYES